MMINAPYTLSLELDVALKKLKICTIKVFKLVHKKLLNSNAGKCNLITSSTSLAEFQIENALVLTESNF